MIILDTHVLLWRMLEPERLTADAAEVISTEGELAVSAVTFQEVAYLVARRRVDLYKPVASWCGDALAALGAVALPVSTSIALRAGSLDPQGFHGDPMDRLVYASAVEQDARLVTADDRLRRFDPERTLW